MLSLKDILSFENLISKKSQYTKKSNQKETYRLDHNPIQNRTQLIHTIHFQDLPIEIITYCKCLCIVTK